MDKLLNKISLLNDVLPGWCPKEKAFALAATVIAIRPSVCVGVGVFGGRVEIALALACEHIGHGRVYAIDPWSKSASVEGMDGKNFEWWASLDHEQIYQHFRQQLDRNDLVNRVTVLRKRSDEIPVLATFPNIDVLSLDGNHSADVCSYDTREYASRVVPGGMLFYDDIDWASAGAGLLEGYGFRKLYNIGTGAVFRRVVA